MEDTGADRLTLTERDQPFPMENARLLATHSLMKVWACEDGGWLYEDVNGRAGGHEPDDCPNPMTTKSRNDIIFIGRVYMEYRNAARQAQTLPELLQMLREAEAAKAKKEQPSRNNCASRPGVSGSRDTGSLS